jgi:hypothetical protein
MNPRDLTVAVVRFNDLTARQLVKDAAREGFSWADAPAPDFRGPRLRAVYAPLVELFADRQGKAPPGGRRTSAPRPRRFSSYARPRSRRRCAVFAKGEAIPSESFRGKRYGALMTGHFGIPDDIDLDSLKLLNEMRALATRVRNAEEDVTLLRIAEKLAHRSPSMALEVWIATSGKFGAPEPSE